MKAAGRRHWDKRPPAWGRTTELLKALAFHRAINSRGGTAFTLNLSPKVIAAAMADPLGFKSHIRRRVDRALVRRFKRHVGFWFVIETHDGRPHLHGGLLLTINEKEDGEAALRKAGGKWASRAGEEYQAEIKVHDDADHGSQYATKNLGQTAKHIPGGLLTATNDVRLKAKQIYNELRNQIIDAS